MLELHVWGPAFGLPSIDAHCLAAVAYLQQAVPRGEWCLIASSNPGLSPTNELPALRNGDIWIGGFRNIFHYIAQYSAGEWVLDAGLHEQASADCIAFSSFLDAHAQPILDLSLYVSSQNYATTTRPLFNTIQPFPLPYLTPTALRAAAKIRTAHLGLEGLDIDSDDPSQSSADHSIIPESLRRPKNTVSSLLAASPETNAQIRLDALATDVLEPLSKLRGEKRYLVSDYKVTSLDCLALGYLCLMLVADLPQPWLSKTFRTRFPKLSRWTEELRQRTYGEVTLADAMLDGDVDGARDAPEVNGASHLPWRKNDTGGVLGTGVVFVNTLADSIPGLGMLRRKERMKQHGEKVHEAATQIESWPYLLPLIGAVLAGAGSLVSWAWYQGLLGAGDEEPLSSSEGGGGGGLRAFGDAGEMLGLYATHMDAETEKQRLAERNYSHGEPVVEVDVDVQRRPI